MRRIAYLRVSTAEQRPDRQIDGLTGMADELHIETLSAVARRRPVYEKLVAGLQSGDTLVVWALDRAYRCAREALNELHALKCRGIYFHIANLDLDTSTPHGKLTFTLMSGIAEFERDLLVQRTKEGIEAARQRGVRIGRPPKLTEQQLVEAHCRVMAKIETKEQIAAAYGLWRWSLMRAIKRSAVARPH